MPYLVRIIFGVTIQLLIMYNYGALEVIRNNYSIKTSYIQLFVNG